MRKIELFASIILVASMVSSCATMPLGRTGQLKSQSQIEHEAMEDFENVIFESPKDDIQGEKHFKVFDTDNLFYNFSIKEESPAYSLEIGDLRNL